MTTHFTSGVTNVGADSTLGKFKAPAPHKYHTYFNDFDTYLASDWTITTTEDGTGSATEALADGDGGLLRHFSFPATLCSDWLFELSPHSTAQMEQPIRAQHLRPANQQE